MKDCNRWISVNERLPKSGKLLILAIKYHYGESDVTVGEYWSSDGTWYSGLFGDMSTVEVTHWRELPKVPN